MGDAIDPECAQLHDGSLLKVYADPATIRQRARPPILLNRRCKSIIRAYRVYSPDPPLFASSGRVMRPSPPNLNRLLPIFRTLILDSRVDAGIRSLAAAPEGPETRPLLSASAASMISRSPRDSPPIDRGTVA